MDKDKVRNMLFFRKQMHQIRQYEATRTVFIMQLAPNAFSEPIAETGIGNIKNHRKKATVPSDLFEHLDIFVFPVVFKSVFVFEGKQDVGNHQYCNKDQAVQIEPLQSELPL